MHLDDPPPARREPRTAGSTAAPRSAPPASTYLISREIGIDAGHRVADHASKCRNLHGHRYRIQAWCRGSLYAAGEQRGMVIDFGFLKDEMMRHIDAPFDHAFIFANDDRLCREMFGVDGALACAIEEAIAQHGVFSGCARGGSRICVLPGTPTAEGLACFWFEALAPRVVERSAGQATLVCLMVWETPNCWAAYGPEAGCAA